MRHRFTAVLLTLTILLASLIPAPVSITASTIAKAGDSVKNTRSDKQDYNLRTGPTTAVWNVDGSLKLNETALIIRVVKGERVEPFGDDWYELQTSAGARYLIVDTNNQTIIPASPSPTPSPTPTVSYRGRVLEISRNDGDIHHIRTSPDASINTNIIATVSNGARMAIVDEHSGKISKANDSRWFSVAYNNQIGYIYIDGPNMVIRDSSATVKSTYLNAYEAFLTASSNVNLWTNSVNSYGNAAAIAKLAQANLERNEKQAWLNDINAGKNPFADGNPKHYNFFNIMATPNVGVIDGARINGVRFAMGLSSNQAERSKFLLPWDTQEKAAKGGAIWIADRYVNSLQDSIFYQKFNLKHKTQYYIQYMQAIEAPRSESSRIYKAYKDTNSLDDALTFLIPVFSSMPQYPSYDPANEVNTDAAKKAKYNYDFTLSLEQLLSKEGIDLSKSSDLYNDLKQFPDITYWKPLIDIHKQYPKWRFVAETTRDNWTNILKFQVWENDQRSLIQDLSYNQAYIKDHDVHDGTNWVSANEAAVAYFMDPRNFLNLSQSNPSRSSTTDYHQGQIFMFLSLRFSEDETLSGIERMYASNPQLKAISSLLYDAAKHANVSAYFLASRMQQEVTDWSYGNSIANNARGTIDIKYPPLAPGQDSLTYMSVAERRNALQTYIATKNAEANRYEQYLSAVSSLNSARTSQSASSTSFFNASNSLVNALSGGTSPVPTAAPTPKPTATPRPTVAPTSTPRPTTAPTSTPKPTAVPTATPKPTVRGDLNNDGRVSTADILVVFNHMAGISILTGDRFVAADLNNSNTVTTSDILVIFSIMSGR